MACGNLSRPDGPERTAGYNRLISSPGTRKKKTSRRFLFRAIEVLKNTRRQTNVSEIDRRRNKLPYIARARTPAHAHTQLLCTRACLV